ncbi:hypothetical protein HYQ44_020151 [Verticillium longisporum]|nr:hypothetical protein HYQ44_020151 [Verticillium longisporum]
MGLVGGETRTQEQKQEEIRLRAMLVECFDEDQMNRYENWRAAKLTDNVVKREAEPHEERFIDHVRAEYQSSPLLLISAVTKRIFNVF